MRGSRRRSGAWRCHTVPEVPLPRHARFGRGRQRGVEAILHEAAEEVRSATEGPAAERLRG